MGEIVRKNPINDPGSKPVKNHSTFQPNYSLYQSPVFGLNTPFFAMAGVAGDDISMRLNSDIDTFSLQAPSMTPVKASTDFFMLPMRCLLPNAAELIITNPLRGDDVDAEEANCVLDLSAYSDFVGDYISYLNVGIVTPGTTITTDTLVRNWFRLQLLLLQIGSRLFSTNALWRHLGYGAGDVIRFSRDSAAGTREMCSFDDYFATFISWLRVKLAAASVKSLDVTWRTVTRSTSSNPTDITTSTYVKKYFVGPVERTPLNATIDDLVYDLFTSDDIISGVSNTVVLSNFLSGTDFDNPYDAGNWNIYGVTPQHHLNLLRLLAYQKASAEFYTVDTIDDVYSAQLWEKNQLGFAVLLASGVQSPEWMLQNGVAIPYDACAGAYIRQMFANLQTIVSAATSPSSDQLVATMCYFFNLFSYTRSLRYQDYFVGSRVNPLAVGDVSVAVNNSKVDVVDVTKKIQVQRFLNQVNRVGRKFNEYVKGILGEAPMADAHEPIFLAHVTDTLGAEETSNTGAAQVSQPQSKTSNYRSNANRYAFTVHVPEPAVIIGIRNFDIPRVYGTVTDRENYHIDRYDAFNPFMQFVGDQEIYADELIYGVSGNFGYTPRYSEYKQRVSIASGSFLAGRLPGYAKIMDYNYFRGISQINSDFIRARLSDLDEFYLNRAMNDPASAMHFIIRNDMDVTAHRPMAFNPSIL